MGISVSINDPVGSARKTKRGTKFLPVQVDSLDTSLEDALEQFIYREPIRQQMPMFSRWNPVGRDWTHGPDEIEMLLPELEGALATVEPGSDAARLLEKLLAMSRRAIEENLVMEVTPD